MSDNLADLVLRLLPDDGSPIGNVAMMTLLSQHVPGVTQDDYLAARDSLIAAGLVGRGRGRGGSIYLVQDVLSSDDEEEPSDDEIEEFGLTPTEEPPLRQRNEISRPTVYRTLGRQAAA